MIFPDEELAMMNPELKMADKLLAKAYTVREKQTKVSCELYQKPWEAEHQKIHFGTDDGTTLLTCKGYIPFAQTHQCNCLHLSSPSQYRQTSLLYITLFIMMQYYIIKKITLWYENDKCRTHIKLWTHERKYLALMDKL